MTCVSFCSIKFSHLVAITMRLCVNPVWDVSAQFLGSFAVCLVTVFHPFCPFCIVVISLPVSGQFCSVLGHSVPSFLSILYSRHQLVSFAVCLVTVFHPFCPFCIVVI